MLSIYRCFTFGSKSLIETNDKQIIALDSKFNFDGNALFRQRYIEMRDLSEEDEMEVEAGSYNLNYIKLDGNVGCMVNGAGLAMSYHGYNKTCWWRSS